MEAQNGSLPARLVRVTVAILAKERSEVVVQAYYAEFLEESESSCGLAGVNRRVKSGKKRKLNTRDHGWNGVGFRLGRDGSSQLLQPTNYRLTQTIISE